MERLRGSGLEKLDRPTEDPAELRTSLLDLARLNRLFGGTRAILSEIERVWRERRLRGPIWALDAGCGAADVLQALSEWGRRQNVEVRAFGCDLQAPVLAVAADLLRNGRRPALVRANAAQPPFRPESFDVVTCSLLLHHLSEAEVVSVLRRLKELARHELIVCDLERSPLARLGVRLAARAVCQSPWTHHDAAISVRRAYTLQELRTLSEQADCAGMRWRRGPLFRLTGVLER